MYIHPWCIFFQAWTCRILCISSCFAESQNKICHQSHLLRPFITYSQNAPDRGYFVSHSCSRNNHRWAPHHFCTAEGSWRGELNGQPDQSRGSRPGDTEHQSTDSAGCRMGLSFFFSVLGLCWFLCLRRGGLLFVAVHSSRHAGFSSCGLQTLEHRVSSCGAQAVALQHMWDLPRPGIKPMSPTLKGGFSATVPPRKSSVGHYHHGFQLFDPRRPTHLSFPGCTPRSWREII